MEQSEIKSQLIRITEEVTNEALVSIGARPSLTEKITAAITENGVTLGFTVLIVVLFSTVLVMHFRFPGRTTNGFVAAAPGLLTTLGILGTFFGIFLGLLDFNVDAIDKSVPTLLQGLKVAFITSILGITAALLLRSILSVSRPPGPVDDIGPEDIYRVLRDIREANIDASRELRGSISGMGKQSLSSQIEALRHALQGQSTTGAQISEAGFEALIAEIRKLNERTGNVVDLMERLDDQATQLEQRLDDIGEQIDETGGGAKRAGDER